MKQKSHIMSKDHGQVVETPCTNPCTMNEGWLNHVTKNWW